MPAFPELEGLKAGPTRAISGIKVGDVIWVDGGDAKKVTYMTKFDQSLSELTLVNAAGEETKATYNADFEVKGQDATTIVELLKAKNPDDITVSFEYFPPKTEKGAENLMARIGLMSKANPFFMDVTWGAGGGTSDLTLELCTNAQAKWGCNANLHLTCTNMEKEKIDEALAGCKAVGIRNIVALRGDPPVGQEEWKAIDTGFSCALDLVKYIREKHGDYFCLSVAGYPEGHPTVIADDGKCPPEKMVGEMAYLKEKVDAGGDLIITQLFFDVDIFLNFVSECDKLGIKCPIVPGIMILTSYAGFKKMAGFCKTWIPEKMAAEIEEIKDDEAAVKEYGVAYATQMCRDLIAAGHKHLHFYCLNVEGPTFAVMERLGLEVPTK